MIIGCSMSCPCSQGSIKSQNLEAIELQDPAYPYHDWNEKITAECHATNAKSRILGS